MNRFHLPLRLLIISVLLIGGLAGVMLWTQPQGPLHLDQEARKPALIIWCAEGLRPPVEELVKAFTEETGRKVEIRSGPSETIKHQLQLTGEGDLFLPADEKYILQAKQEDLLEDVMPIATMKAVLLVRDGFTRPIRTWSDLMIEGTRIVQANEAAAIGELTRLHLSKPGLQKWEALKSRTKSFLGTVNQVANAIKDTEEFDVGIVWDAVARGPKYRHLRMVNLAELDSVQAVTQLAVCKKSAWYSDAIQLARFLTAREPGLKTFADFGFTVVDSNSPPKPDVVRQSPKERPEILLYAGTMLRPAIEETIKEFEEREGVRITRVYNGCGILVSQMKAGERPDAYFACDTMFMQQVGNLFEEPLTLSRNRLVIAVPKGNPKQIRTLKDLGQPGLQIGVGHEQQCALGTLTKGVFIQNRVYKAVMENVKVQSPSGDTLISQLRAKSLDAVVAYKSNVTPFENEIDAVELEEINCTPMQPVAVSKSSAHREIVLRLIKALESVESRERFEKLGFGWQQSK